MMLPDKIAIIYGAGGAIGKSVAETFAREGAKLFITGRSKENVDKLARKINDDGGFAEAAQVDALDEKAVEKHLKMVIAKAGRVDISFNAVGVPNTKILGVSLAEMDAEQFFLPIANYTRS